MVSVESSVCDLDDDSNYSLVPLIRNSEVRKIFRQPRRQEWKALRRFLDDAQVPL
jgi:hypothetical protein